MPPVTIQLDFCFNLLPIPLCAPHNYIPCPPFPPVPPPMPGAVGACMALEIPVPAWWPPGYALGGASFTTTVFHKFMQICLEGRDCGKFIPHVQLTPAPNNTLTLLHIPLSKRSANFASSTVKMNGKGVAAMTLISWPPCPMTYCAEPVGSESDSTEWGKPGATSEQTTMEPFNGFRNTHTKTSPDGTTTRAQSRPATTPLVNAL